MARKAAGEDPLPEEDPSNPIFKPIPEPPRLDSFLITNQISNYCNQINGYATNPLIFYEVCFTNIGFKVMSLIIRDIFTCLNEVMGSK